MVFLKFEGFKKKLLTSWMTNICFLLLILNLASISEQLPVPKFNNEEFMLG